MESNKGDYLDPTSISILRMLNWLYFYFNFIHMMPDAFITRSSCLSHTVLSEGPIIPTHYNLLHSNVLFLFSKLFKHSKFFRTAKTLLRKIILENYLRFKFNYELKYLKILMTFLCGSSESPIIFCLSNRHCINQKTCQFLFKNYYCFEISEKRMVKWLKQSKSRCRAITTYDLLIACVICDILTHDCNSYCSVSSC